MESWLSPLLQLVLMDHLMNCLWRSLLVLWLSVVHLRLTVDLMLLHRIRLILLFRLRSLSLLLWDIDLRFFCWAILLLAIILVPHYIPLYLRLYVLQVRWHVMLWLLQIAFARIVLLNLLNLWLMSIHWLSILLLSMVSMSLLNLLLSWWRMLLY